MASDPSVGMLALDLDHRVCCRDDPECADGGQTCWMATVSHPSYLKKDCSGKIVISVPANQLPTPHIVRSYPVRVTVVTPCCGDPLEGVPVYAAGSFACTTGSNGVAEFRLPIGRYVLSAPGISSSEEAIEL